MSDHPVSRLDDVVHQRVRLGILTVLSEVPKAEFGALRKLLGVTDGNLASHLRVLEDAALITTDKAFRSRKPLTMVRITAAGRKALRLEIEALSELLQLTRLPSDA